MKTCFKCGLVKSIADFYKHPQMADGHLGKCKDCTKRDMRVDRQTKPRVREYDRERSNLPHRAALRVKVCKAWIDANPGKRNIHLRVSRAVKKGLISKPTACEGCGLPGKRLEGHHHDYSKPMAVIWLCKPCHAIADKVRRRMESF